MQAEDIIQSALALRSRFNTQNPFLIADQLGITIRYSKLNKNASQGYCLKPPNIPPVIILNSSFEDMRSQVIFCAHELCHAIFHDGSCNHFNDDNLVQLQQEYEANLFAVALLFDHDAFNMSLSSMNNYILKGILNANVRY